MPGSVEYHGTAGVTQHSLEAVQLLFMSDLRITAVRMLTFEYRHSFLFTVAEHHYIAVKSGFASGYVGEGSTGLSAVLNLFSQWGLPGAEVHVDEDTFRRLDRNSLTEADLDKILSTPATSDGLPWALSAFGRDSSVTSPAPAWYRSRHVIPTSIIDSRLHELVAQFWRDPDGTLLKAFRKLEHTVRKRTGLDGQGQTLMSAAFQRKDSPLWWPDATPGEGTGRALLFCGAFGAYRNPEAHHERNRNGGRYLSELLVVNELFLLEAQAKERVSVAQRAV